MEAALGLLDTLRGWFGGSDDGGRPAADPIEHAGFMIEPAPQRTASGWNTAGVISKIFPDGRKEHRFIRVDSHSSRDDAIAFSIVKARQIIDEQGDRLFHDRR